MIDYKSYVKWNNLGGWLVFAISAIVYFLTMGPTASLWDCAEFIATINKLEIGHPPGAPFFMLVYNLATNLTSSPDKVALFANGMSALISAFTIMFLFWTVTHLLRRVVAPGFGRKDPTKEVSLAEAVVILLGGLVGALTYTFTDTFWFSAIEAEVYAFSSLFTAIVFWLIFVWEERADEPDSDRWLILIAYLMGLSVGVHLLNLLCIPAMGLVYYYKKTSKPTLKGWIATLAASFGLIVVMMYGIIQGIPKMAGYFDYFFVNSLGLSYNTGLFFYVVLLLVILIGSYALMLKVDNEAGQASFSLKLAFLLSLGLMGIPLIGKGAILHLLLFGGLAFVLYRAKLNLKRLRIIQMGLIVITIGFMSYGVILVRAMADPPMNENAPADAFSLRYYLAREQYGSVPLLYGPSFTSTAKGQEVVGETLGRKGKRSLSDADEYVETPQLEVVYDSSEKMLFPRAYDRGHARSYNTWMGRNPQDKSPVTFGDNLYYAINYQVNYMYWRYFFWNFVGRQNDLYGSGELTKGNALTGISFIDNMLYGDQSKLPDSFKNNPGRNVYYLLPLILGLLGIFYQIQTKSRYGLDSFWITLVLFLMTGLAIVAYINQYPDQPRERDYAYAGSFYAFAIWIGFGVAGLWSILKRAKLQPLPAALATAILLFVPLQMASENWDDHDRSTRTIARDMGSNYLESCEENGVIFCFGDNDTFPMWYAQDVEGIRRDVRAVNLSYLTAEWYVDQQRKDAWTAKGLPMKHMTPDFYYPNALVLTNPSNKSLGVDEAFSAMSYDTRRGYYTIPSDKFYVSVGSDMKSYVAERLPDLMQASQVDSIKPQLTVLSEFPLVSEKGYLDRSSLAALDFLYSNRWERPIYTAITSPQNLLFDNLSQHQAQVGLANQWLPIALSEEQTDAPLMVDRMYEVVTKKFRWCGADTPNTYFDENARGMVQGLRNNVLAPLAEALLERGDKKRAIEILQLAIEKIRPECVPYQYTNIRLISALYNAGMQKEADEILSLVGKEQYDMLGWILDLPEDKLLQEVNNGNLYQTVRIAYWLLTLAKQDHNRDILDYTESRINLAAGLINISTGGKR